MKKISSSSRFLFLFLCGSLAPLNGFSATRTVYFDQTAVNTSVHGFSSATTSRCTVVINNPSGQSQDITMSIYASAESSVAAMAGNAVAVPTTGFSGTSPIVLSSQNIPSTQSKKYDFDYPTFPALTAGQQQLFCRGSITVTDTNPANPGFVVASGLILSFTESSIVQTVGASVGATAFGGSVVFTQVPLSINRGKPF